MKNAGTESRLEGEEGGALLAWVRRTFGRDGSAMRFWQRARELYRSGGIILAFLFVATAAIEFAAYVPYWMVATKGRRRLAIAILGLLALGRVAMGHANAADGTPASCGTGPVGFVDSVSNELTGDMTSWTSELLNSVTPLFLALMSFSFILSMVLELPKTQGHVGHVFQTFAGLLFIPVIVATLFFQAPTMGPAIVNNLTSSVSSIGGSFHPAFTSISGIEPGSIFMKFECVSDTIDNAYDGPTSGLDLLHDPVKTIIDALAGFLAEIGTAFAGMLAMVETFMLKAETMFVLAAGAVLMVGLGNPLLYGFPMRYLGALIGLGLKGLTLAMVTGLAISKASIVVDLFTANKMPPPHDLFVVLFTLLGLTMLGWFLPNILQTLGGAPALSFGTAMAAGMSVVSAAQTGTGMFSKLGGGGGGGGSASGGDGAGEEKGGAPGGGDNSTPIELVPG